MKHNTLQFILCLFLVSSGLVGCTGAGDSSSLAGSITDTVKGIISPDPSVNKAEKQVSEIQNNLNQNITYALTQDDVAFLKTEGLLNNENEIKGWVK